MSSIRFSEELRPGGACIALWAAVLGAPAVWAIQMQGGYALVPEVCKKNGGYIFLHLITIVAALLALLGAFLSWRQWRATGRESPDNTDGGPVARRRFIGALGVFSGILYAMLIIAQGIASLFFDACWS